MKIRNHTWRNLISKQRILIICIQDKLDNNIKSNTSSKDRNCKNHSDLGIHTILTIILQETIPVKNKESHKLFPSFDILPTETSKNLGPTKGQKLILPSYWEGGETLWANDYRFYEGGGGPFPPTPPPPSLSLTKTLIPYRVKIILQNIVKTFYFF